MLNMFAISALAPWLLGVALAPAVDQPPDDDAAAAFQEMEALCDADADRLWGVRVCGATMLVDPTSRRIVANEDGAETGLHSDGRLFSGILPPEVGLANTSIHWNGRDWAMVLWPLPAGKIDRDILLVHENWHRIQAGLGLPARSWDEDHLATTRGRIAMRLELRALAAALRGHAEVRETAMRDAVTFRRWRQAMFKGAIIHENGLELNEGLAEYTGRRLSNDPAMIERMALRLDAGDHVEAFARSFAYYTGPAYGMLLDEARPTWRADLKRVGDLGELLASTLTSVATSPSSRVIAERGRVYGLHSIRSEEELTGRLRSREDARWRAQLVKGPLVLLPVSGANITFDPRRVSPLPPYGAVYPTMSVSGVWGRLTVNAGALLDREWSKIALAREGLKTSPAMLKGRGWELKLRTGWSWKRGARPKDIEVTCVASSQTCGP